MERIFDEIRKFLANRFDLQEDKADDPVIIDAVWKNVEFKGANLFALIFAILIASIGLNVNSTAVIIGAMLISPIMGPVMGIGLGVGINDFELVKKGVKNLLVASIIGILTSWVYFLITPLHEAQSELLARTSPSIWDVFIAFFGGLAGMVAASRKEKNNVIPGVAIATALMPPLCTAGYGIAIGNWFYFLGAIYLYFINSVFIAIATFLMARYLKMQRKHFETAVRQKQVTSYIVIIVIVTMLPSIYMAFRIVNESIFEANSRKFVEQQFQFKSTQVVSHKYSFNGRDRSIDLLLIGRILDTATIESLQNRLPRYKLKGVKLNIRQGLTARRQIDLSQIKASILEDVYANAPKNDTVKIRPDKRIPIDSSVFVELKVLYPAVKSFGTSRMLIYSADSTKKDTVIVALARFQNPMKQPDIDKLRSWLIIRYRLKRINLVIQNNK